MWNDNDVEALLKEEWRDKKRTGTGAYHNSGRRGGGLKGIKQGIRMPSDLIKFGDKKAYKEYVKGGEVKVSNMFEDINNLPKWDELMKKDTKAVTHILNTAREFHDNKKLFTYWGVTGYTYYKTLKKYGIEVDTRRNWRGEEESTEAADYLAQQEEKIRTKRAYNRKNVVQPQVETAATSVSLIDQQKQVLQEAQIMNALQPILQQVQNQLQIINHPPKAVEDDDELFQIRFIKKELTGDIIMDRLTNYISILDKNTRYEVKFVIKELPEVKPEPQQLKLIDED